MSKLNLFGSDETEAKCKHETQDIRPTDDTGEIWIETDSHLEGDPYWANGDACFHKMRTKRREFKCKGCGQETAIQTGEVIDTVWKEDLTAGTIGDLREKATAGSWYNGRLWWEEHKWDGEPDDVTNAMDEAWGEEL